MDTRTASASDPCRKSSGTWCWAHGRFCTEQTFFLGLHGKISSGKSDTSRRIAHLLDGHLPVHEITFGRKLKESIATFLGVSVEQIEQLKNDLAAVVTVGDYIEPEWVRPSHSIVPFRVFLQHYGDGLREALDANLWLDAAVPTKLLPGLHVATDVRYPNEAEFVRAHGGPIVHVIGPAVSAWDEHDSEQVLPADHVIDNSIRDDNFASLDGQLRQLLQDLGLLELHLGQEAR